MFHHVFDESQNFPDPDNVRVGFAKAIPFIYQATYVI